MGYNSCAIGGGWHKEYNTKECAKEKQEVVSRFFRWIPRGNQYHRYDDRKEYEYIKIGIQTALFKTLHHLFWLIHVKKDH